MALITNASSTWQAASATSTREGWQVQDGGVLLSTDTSPSGLDGIYLAKNEYIEFGSGLTVRYRLSPSETSAVIVRTTVG